MEGFQSPGPICPGMEERRSAAMRGKVVLGIYP